MRLSTFASAVLITLLVTSHVVAQYSDSQPRAEIKMFVGASDFGLDSEPSPHFVVGAATRIHISRHWSIEPEFNFMRGSSNDHDYIFQPNVVYEFNRLEDRVVPYLIAGVGVIRHKSVFQGSDFVTGAPVTIDTSYTRWSGSAGGGLKVFVSKHLFVAPELRLGLQPTARATVSIGYVFPVRD